MESLLTRDYVVLNADAMAWLPGIGEDLGPGTAIITSLPDAAETDMDLATWSPWFARAVAACLSTVADDMPVVFFQTDRREGGRLHSKAHMILHAAESMGRRVLWHKVVLRRSVGSVDIHRPGFSHLIAVSMSGRPGMASPDVLPQTAPLGPGTRYTNAMPWAALDVALSFVQYAGATGVLDPFCGRGSTLRAASDRGLRAWGIDIDPDQCEHARTP